MSGTTWKMLLILIIIMVGHCATAQSPEKLANKKKVQRLIEMYQIQHPDIVLRQAMYESGWLMCTNCSWGRYNNPFGFRHRSYVSDSNPFGYLYFEGVEEAVLYYLRWQLKYYRGGDYYEFLKDIGYATRKNYTEELKKMW
jgi:hypothetical protein